MNHFQDKCLTSIELFGNEFLQLHAYILALFTTNSVFILFLTAILLSLIRLPGLINLALIIEGFFLTCIVIIAVSSIHKIDNAKKIINVLNQFGFSDPSVTIEVFSKDNQIFRMGVPPLRLELFTTISGVDFNDCYASKVEEDIDGVSISFINLAKLKQNKKASGRHIDLNDLENLP